LESIRNLECSESFRKLNFQPTLEIRQLGTVKRQTEYYKVTKDGFAFLVMGFTGIEAARFKEEYINHFNERGREIYRLAKQKAAQEAIAPFQQEISQLNTRLSHANFALSGLNDLIAANKRKIKYADLVLASDGVYTTTELAAQLDMTAQALNKKLNEMKIIYQNGKHWLLRARYMGKGYQKARTNVHTRLNAANNSNTYMVWTETGRLFVHNKINPLHPVRELQAQQNQQVAA
jgi:Rha family phage regulatory protein